MTIEPTALTLAVLAGAALGALFFGGLWWTVRRGLASPNPAAWFLISLVLRTGVTVLGFILVSAGHWERAAGCLLGFLLARILVTRLTRSPLPGRTGLEKGAGHAP